MSSLDDILTTAQAAEHVNVSRNLIDYWRTTGRLKPAGRYGRSWLYRRGDVADTELAMRDSSQSRRGTPIPEGAAA